MTRISRRTFLVGSAAVAAVAVTPGCERPAPQTGQAERSGGSTARIQYVFFSAEEAAFIESAVARLIPNDALGPGALEAGVPAFMDRQLAGAWGAGQGFYRAGPWASGSPEQGYQLPLTPAELFRKALRAIREDLSETAPEGFGALGTADKDAYLKTLEEGDRDLGEVPSNVFFEFLWDLTLEGFFSDPVYGGNRDMVGWKLVGFPGAYANYYEFVDRHGVAFRRPPVSLGQDAIGNIHLHPAPPADREG